MAKRFSRYKFAAKVSGGAAGAGSALDEYNKFRNGTKTVRYPRAETSNPGNTLVIYIEPFGTSITATQKYAIGIGTRANNQKADLISDINLFGHKAKPAAAEDILINESFQPAVAVIRTGGSGTSPETSKITGEPYKKRTGAASYTIPIGSDGANLYFDQIKLIDASVNAKNSNYTVSFKPEFWGGV